MTGRILEFKKCCFCLPLHRGLLAWGYTKLVAGFFFISYLTFIVLIFMIALRYEADTMHIVFAYTILFCLIHSITDFVTTIVFIAGGHKKNMKPIKGFYKFSIGDLIVTTLLSLVLVGLSIVFAQKAIHEYPKYLLFFQCAFYLVTLVVKGYFILLLRSEVIKLKSSEQFRFVNNSAEAEAQCTMLSKQNETEKQTEMKEEPQCDVVSKNDIVKT